MRRTRTLSMAPRTPRGITELSVKPAAVAAEVRMNARRPGRSFFMAVLPLPPNHTSVLRSVPDDLEGDGDQARGAVPEHDVEQAGLHDAGHVLVGEPQGFRTEREADGPLLPRGEADALEPPQLLHRPRDRRHAAADVEPHHLVARPRSAVG